MKLVAIVRAPAHADEAARALADAGGQTLAEARMRLAPEPPALVARLEADAADALVAALRKAGVAALAVEAKVPTDRDRTIVRALSFGSRGVTFSSRAGASRVVSWGDVVAILRGVRAASSQVEREERSKRLSVGRAVLTGGLVMTRTTSKAVRSYEESTEQVILLYPRDGGAAVLTEAEVDFSCLGASMQPSSTANMVELARRLRDGAKGAFHDDRLLRLGRRPLPFVAGGESRSRTDTTTVTRTDTSSSLDVLAEVMRQALVPGLLL